MCSLYKFPIQNPRSRKKPSKAFSKHATLRLTAVSYKLHTTSVKCRLSEGIFMTNKLTHTEPPIRLLREWRAISLREEKRNGQNDKREISPPPFFIHSSLDDVVGAWCGGYMPPHPPYPNAGAAGEPELNGIVVFPPITWPPWNKNGAIWKGMRVKNSLKIAVLKTLYAFQVYKNLKFLRYYTYKLVPGSQVCHLGSQLLQDWTSEQHKVSEALRRLHHSVSPRWKRLSLASEKLTRNEVFNVARTIFFFERMQSGDLITSWQISRSQNNDADAFTTRCMNRRLPNVMGTANLPQHTTKSKT